FTMVGCPFSLTRSFPDGRSQTPTAPPVNLPVLKSPTPPPETSVRPSAETARFQPLASGPSSLARSAGRGGFHRRISPSSPAEASSLPSADQATVATPF